MKVHLTFNPKMYALPRHSPFKVVYQYGVYSELDIETLHFFAFIPMRTNIIGNGYVQGP